MTGDGTVKEGWAIPSNSRKAHYFITGRALCRRWLFLGKIYADEQIATKQLPDDCKKCYETFQEVKRLRERLDSGKYDSAELKKYERLIG